MTRLPVAACGVVAARLLDGTAENAVPVELPIGDLEGLAAGTGTLREDEGTLPFDELFDLVRAGGAVLELETDVVGRERVRLALVDATFSDWPRPSCD